MGFPLTPSPVVPIKPSPYLQIVGHCQVCGSPIYGQVRISQGEVPTSVYSCDCFNSKSFDKTIRQS